MCALVGAAIETTEMPTPSRTAASTAVILLNTGVELLGKGSSSTRERAQRITSDFGQVSTRSISGACGRFGCHAGASATPH
jgi:hypothetical protein